MFSRVFSLDNFLLKVLPKSSIFAVLWEEEGFTKDIFHDSVFKQGLGNVLQYTCYPTQVLIKGFVKSNNQQPSDYRATNHRPFTHRSIDLIMITKRLGNSKTFISRNTNAARNVFRSVCCLMNNICSQNLKCLQKKCSFPQNTYRGINVYFKGFKLYSFTPSLIFQISFMCMEMSFTKCFFRSQ